MLRRPAYPEIAKHRPMSFVALWSLGTVVALLLTFIIASPTARQAVGVGLLVLLGIVVSAIVGFGAWAIFAMYRLPQKWSDTWLSNSKRPPDSREEYEVINVPYRMSGLLAVAVGAGGVFILLLGLIIGVARTVVPDLATAAYLLAGLFGAIASLSGIFTVWSRQSKLGAIRTNVDAVRNLPLTNAKEAYGLPEAMSLQREILLQTGDLTEAEMLDSLLAPRQPGERTRWRNARS